MPAGAMNTKSTDPTTRPLSVVLIGNPNIGKTTLFNALTGLRHRVGNYPGVTVETKTGFARFDGEPLAITDVPGTYSLAPRSPDEMLAVDLLLGDRSEHDRPDVIVSIVDASNLERNLYLTTQILELGIPTVLALNMMDVARARGIGVEVAGLSRALGIPVVAVQANIGAGLDALSRAICAAARAAPPAARPEFPAPFQAEARALACWTEALPGGPAKPYLVERAILDRGGAAEDRFIQRYGPDVRARLDEIRARLGAADCPIPAIEARTRYGWITQCLAGVVQRPAVRAETLSDRIDRIVIHRVWGVLIFLLMMALVFQSIYGWATWLMDPIEAAFLWLATAARDVVPPGALQELLANGVIAGVGNVLVFLPQIVILFGFIAILEDCGYMARAAFLMDRVMARCGLSGRSFVPLLSSFACAIPGIMATRTIEDRRDRFTTILVAPLMSCSARLPVYVLLIGAFIPATTVLGGVGLQGFVLFCLYLIGLVVAPLVAWTLKRTLLAGEIPVFLMELPSYKLPSARTVLERMVDRGVAFCRRAGTLILATTVVIWALQYYPRPASVRARFEPELAAIDSASRAPAEELVERRRELENRIEAAYQEQSLLGRMGKAIEPVVVPLGWDWRIGMAALAAFPAREVVVSALGTIYSVGAEVDDESPSLRSALRAASWPDGRPVFTLATALSLMVFFALCCQCGATLAVIRRETNSWRWPAFTFAYMTGLAYVGALVTYQVATRLG